MGVIRADSVRVTDWAGRSVGSAWRAFDLQLVTYAGLLVAVGLVMAAAGVLLIWLRSRRGDPEPRENDR